MNSTLRKRKECETCGAFGASGHGETGFEHRLAADLQTGSRDSALRAREHGTERVAGWRTHRAEVRQSSEAPDRRRGRGCILTGGGRGCSEVRQACGEIAQRMGFRVAQAADTKGAQAIVRNQKVDLILLDLKVLPR